MISRCVQYTVHTVVLGAFIIKLENCFTVTLLTFTQNYFPYIHSFCFSAVHYVQSTDWFWLWFWLWLVSAKEMINSKHTECNQKERERDKETGKKAFTIINSNIYIVTRQIYARVQTKNSRKLVVYVLHVELLCASMNLCRNELTSIVCTIR